MSQIRLTTGQQSLFDFPQQPAPAAAEPAAMPAPIPLAGAGSRPDATHSWPRPLTDLRKGTRTCTACGMTVQAVKYRPSQAHDHTWGVQWERGGQHEIVNGLRDIPPCGKHAPAPRA